MSESLYDEGFLSGDMKPVRLMSTASRPPMLALKSEEDKQQDAHTGREKLFLDFGQWTGKSAEVQNTATVLSMSTPELEKLIAQNVGAVTTTPTPTTQILFPKSVTEEQEAYARGFIDALERLHQTKGQGQILLDSSHDRERLNFEEMVQNIPVISSSNLQTSEQLLEQRQQFTVISCDSKASDNASYPLLALSNVLQSGLATVDSRATSIMAPKLHVASMQSESGSYGTCLPSLASLVKPTTSCGFSGYSVEVAASLEKPLLFARGNNDVQAVAMDENELVSGEDRLEIKRARNRLAAQKCRGRKLKRISVLSERVSTIKRCNEDYSETLRQLKSDVESLRRELLRHVNRGCSVMNSIGGTRSLLAANIAEYQPPSTPTNISIDQLSQSPVQRGQINARQWLSTDSLECLKDQRVTEIDVCTSTNANAIASQFGLLPAALNLSALQPKSVAMSLQNNCDMMKYLPLIIGERNSFVANTEAEIKTDSSSLYLVTGQANFPPPLQTSGFKIKLGTTTSLPTSLPPISATQANNIFNSNLTPSSVNSFLVSHQLAFPETSVVRDSSASVSLDSMNDHTRRPTLQQMISEVLATGSIQPLKLIACQPLELTDPVSRYTSLNSVQVEDESASESLQLTGTVDEQVYDSTLDQHSTDERELQLLSGGPAFSTHSSAAVASDNVTPTSLNCYTLSAQDIVNMVMRMKADPMQESFVDSIASPSLVFK